MQAAYPKATVFRVEPNVPVAVRRGVLAFAQSADAAAPSAVKALFARVGTVVELPEKLIGVAGAVSGVGPAYWALWPRRGPTRRYVTAFRRHKPPHW